MLRHLSVLDQSPAVAGRAEDHSIRETLALAEHCDTLGYRRFWMSEHHGLAGIAGTAPEVLAAAVAARTRRLRVGTAGVLLPHYSALKVAEQFRTLAALAPGRIDLGLGRAPGGDPRIARALNPHASGLAEDFPQQVRDLQAWTQRDSHRGLTAHPLGAPAPELWILGSSDYGARLAAELGLPYAFAWFFTDGQGAEAALELYRTLYRPSPRHPRPQPTVCVWALAADDAEQARWHALSREHWRMARLRGEIGPLLAPQDVAARGGWHDDHPALQQMRHRAFVGDAASVAQRLRELAAALKLEELVVNTWAVDASVRHRSYELLAREFGLEPAAPPAQNL